MPTFAKADWDRNGILRAAEVFGSTVELRKRLFEAADRDHDGLLSAEEQNAGGFYPAP